MISVVLLLSIIGATSWVKKGQDCEYDCPFACSVRNGTKTFKNNNTALDNDIRWWLKHLPMLGKLHEVMMLYIYTYCMLILYFLTCRGTTDDTWIPIPSARSSYNVRMKTLGFYFYGCWNCLWISGTIKFIMATLRRHTGYSSVYYDYKVDIVLLHIQSFGDSAQALCSCILFCIVRNSTLQCVKGNRLISKNKERTQLLNDAK